MFWHLSLVDASIYREWIANIGQREARARVAFVFCEIMVRMEAAGLASDGKCYFPMTQVELADATGISVVHMNRTMQFLRHSGFLTLADNVLTVLDWPRLVALAKFDVAYLHLEPISL
jgi:CRP-like cAMP-binding protein